MNVDSQSRGGFAEENAWYNDAKRNALNDNVSRFVCAFSSEVAGQLSQKLEVPNRPEMGRTLREDLAKYRSVLDSFVAEKVGLVETVAVLHPIVIDSLHFVPVEHVHLLIRKALDSIAKIEV